MSDTFEKVNAVIKVKTASGYKQVLLGGAVSLTSDYTVDSATIGASAAQTHDLNDRLAAIEGSVLGGITDLDDYPTEEQIVNATAPYSYPADALEDSVLNTEDIEAIVNQILGQYDEQLQTSLSAMNEQIETLNSGLTDATASIITLNNNLVTISGTVDANSSAITSLNSELAAVNEDLSTKISIVPLSEGPEEIEEAQTDEVYAYKAAADEAVETPGSSFDATSEITRINVREEEDPDTSAVEKGELAAFGAGDLL